MRKEGIYTLFETLSPGNNNPHDIPRVEHDPLLPHVAVIYI